MILFVFEGDEREPRLYRTLERLYFPKRNENIICSFGNNIYDLYNELQEYDGNGDIVALMRERLADRGDAALDGIRNSDNLRYNHSKNLKIHFFGRITATTTHFFGRTASFPMINCTLQ